MNLANKLTIARILMIPFFIFFLLFDKGNNDVFRQLSFYIFVLASSTDALDGYIARKYNMVTNFGKFMDPLADKLLICLALICFIELGEISAWIVMVIIAREFIISGFRLVAADSGIVIAAGIWGKLKTVVQTFTVALLILNIESIGIFTDIMIYLMLILTIISLLDYIIKNHKVITEGSM